MEVPGILARIALPGSSTLAMWLALVVVMTCGTVHASTPVVIITIDTLRADHLGCYGYKRDTSPNIDRLAAEGLLFEDAFTTMATTLPAHTSLMTSSYPVRHGVLSNLTSFQQPVVTNREFQSAAQMFQQAGYRTAGFVSSGGVLGPQTGIGIGFQTFDAPPIKSERGESAQRTASETAGIVISWLANQRDGNFFLWVHFWDPHDPYSPPPEYERLFKSDPFVNQYVRDTGVSERHWPHAVEANNLYDGEIRFTDHWIGELFRALRKSGIYDESLIVLTSDHGEGLMQHDNMHHGDTFDEQLQVPLIIKLPEGRGPAPRRMENLVSIIDVLPLITEELDLPFGREQFDGLNPLKHQRDYVIAEHPRTRRRPGVNFQFILRDRKWKYFFLKAGDDRLFDLKTDPHEIQDVIGRHPEVAQSMEDELLSRLEKYRRRGSDLEVSEDIPAELREQLKSLGYVD